MLENRVKQWQQQWMLEGKLEGLTEGERRGKLDSARGLILHGVQLDIIGDTTVDMYIHCHYYVYTKHGGSQWRQQ